MSRRALLPAVLGLLLAACGSGSGGGSPAGPSTPAPAPDSPVFTGAHWHVGLNGHRSVSAEMSVRLGVYDVRAPDLHPLSGTEIRNASDLGSMASAVLAYTEGADRTFEIAEPVPAPLQRTFPSGTGRIAERGDLAVTARLVGGHPDLSFFARRSGGPYSTASLDGIYHMAGLDYSHSLDHGLTLWGTLTFDGVGSCEFSFERSSGGSGRMTLDYSVTPDGTVTLEHAPTGDALRGGLSRGGELGFAAALSGTGTWFFVEASSGQSDAALDGTYHIVGFGYDTVLGFSSLGGTADFDGAGAGSFSISGNREGAPSGSGAGTLTYAVSGDGELNLDTGGLFAGGLTADGRFGVVAGGDNTTGPEPTILLLVR